MTDHATWKIEGRRRGEADPYVSTYERDAELAALQVRVMLERGDVDRVTIERTDRDQLDD